jgi:3-oxoacyl-[acyl-carrier protein] reductase
MPAEKTSLKLIDIGGRGLFPFDHQCMLRYNRSLLVTEPLQRLQKRNARKQSNLPGTVSAVRPANEIASMNFSGKVALVTGAGSPQGIGFATARLLAQQGSRVAITSTTERIEARARELAADGAEVFAFPADLRDHARTQELVREVLARYGRLDILVNNAGMTQIGSPTETASLPLVELSEKEWDYSIALNLKTAFNITKAVLPFMLAANYGRIVNVSSVTGPVVSNPRETAYSAAKAGMVGMTRSLALELARKGITVNAVAPGWIETASSTEHEIIAGRNTPIGRPGRPGEVAAVIAFLASESASYITGQLIIIDGGNALQEYKGPPELYY